MIQKRFDIPFGSDLWISLIVGILLFIGSLSILSSLGLHAYINQWDQSIHGTYTIEIPAGFSDKIPEVLQLLQQQLDVESVSVVDKTLLQNLIDQVGLSIEDTPIFVDLHIRREAVQQFNPMHVVQILHEKVPGVLMRKPMVASAEATSVAGLLESLSLWFGIIMLNAIFLVIIFVTYSEIQVHQRTISLLNLLGAPNYYIAKIFQKYTSVFMIKSILFSSVFNIFIYIGLVITAKNYGINLEKILSWTSFMYVFAAVPFIMFVMAQLVAPLTVIFTLKKNYNNTLHT